MHVFRLVDGGRVDRMIAFDSLPKRLLTGIKKKDLDGYPRYWKAWLKDNNSVHKVKRWNPELEKFDEVHETFTFMLDYKQINEDREKWQAITNYIRKAVDLSVRLMDKIEDMAIPVAKDAVSELSIEPEMVPIIPVPLEAGEREPAPKIIKPSEATEAIVPHETISEEPKRRGRPKKVAVEA